MSPLFALLALQSPAVDVAKDAALAKPITVRLAMAPLRAVVSSLTKETGQPVDVSGTISDLKATVLVKNLSAGRTMEALADTLGLEWRMNGTSYLLTRPEGQLSAESAYVKSERTSVQSGRQGRVDAQAPIQSDSQVTVVDGAPVGTFQRPGRGNRGDNGNGGGRRGPGVRVVTVRFDPTLLAIESANGQPPSRLDPRTPFGTSDYVKGLTAWPKLDKPDAKWSAPTTSVEPPASTWESGAYALSDLLSAWHTATGLPVVADAFRVPMRARAISPNTALASLQGLAAGEGLSLRFTDGVARMRHPAFWRLREQEVTEANWNLVERSGAGALPSLMNFAAGLKPAQAAAFRSAEAPLSHVRTGAIREAYPALLLLNSLPANARNGLLGGRPLALSAVPNAVNAYRFALTEAPFYKAGNPSQLLSVPATELGMFGASKDKAVEVRLATERGQGVTYLVALP